MAEPPVPEPDEIADRIATVARKMVTDTAQVAIDAAAKINDTTGGKLHYTGGDAIRSMTELAGIAVTGWAALARIPLQVGPKGGPMLIADQVATVMERAAADAVAVAGDAAEKIDAGTFRSQWVDSAITLTGMATLRAAEIAEAVAAGPGSLADSRLRFGPFETTVVLAGEELTLKVDTLARPDVKEDIADRIVFDPAGGVLKPGTPRVFWLSIDSSGISSGIYVGKVRVFRKGADKYVDTVKITVNL